MDARGEVKEVRKRAVAPIPDVVGLCDGSGRVLDVKLSTEGIWGSTLREHGASGMSWGDLRLPKEVVDAIEQARADALRTNRPVGSEVRVEGGDRVVECLLTPMPGGVTTVVTLRDVTEVRRAEEALRESERRYRLLAENATDLITRLDPSGTYLYVSPSCRGIVGREPEEMVGRTPFGYIHPDDLPEVKDLLGILRAEPSETFTASFRVLHEDGRYVWLESTFRACRDPKTGEVVEVQASTRDVTRRKVAEDALRVQNARLQEMAESERKAHETLKLAEVQLVQAEKLTALGQMVAGVAHEINNPLAFVSNNMAVLRRDVANLREVVRIYREADPALADCAPDVLKRVRAFDESVDLSYTLDNLERLTDRSREGLKRIQRIVMDLRDFARLDDGDIQSVDLNVGVTSTVNIALGRAGKQGVELVSDLNPLPAVTCYPGKINQVIMNLLANAIEACPAGGKVTVRTEPATTADAVLLHVVDNGQGIGPAVLDRIFDPFFTTKPIGQGTGLGLSISYGIVKAHGGAISVVSEPGRGARFTVRLPLRPQVSATPNGTDDAALLKTAGE